MNIYKDCTLCPRKCHINRYQQKGFCGCDNKIRLALASLFFYEEPPISGTKGSGTIFFSGCNLKCCFCQNMEISSKGKGLIVTITRLSEIMIELQEKGAHNINLVTPTMYVPSIIKAIKKAQKKGLNIPIIYNTSGYETKETIKSLEGIIDVYLPDFKYYDDIYANKYSKANDYSKYAKEALDEMVRQQPKIIIKKGVMQKGVIVRHLILPTLEDDSKKIIKYLYTKYKDNIYISIMNQYTPNKNVLYQELKSPIKEKIYDDIIDYALNIGVTKSFCQVGGTVSNSFIPDFNYQGIKKIKD